MIAGTVVLLHGLNRTQLSMAPLALALRRHGYAVSNRYYHSRAATIEQHADELIKRLRRDARHASGTGPMHFVAHSMGCVVVRCALARCLGVTEESVGLSAKTGEGIGEVGHGRAVGCDAIVLLERVR